MKNSILIPMAVYVFYILLLLFLGFIKRKNAVIKRVIHKDYFKDYRGNDLPMELQIWGRHINNQFEIPILFFVTCLSVISIGVGQCVGTILATLFVVSRFAHSYVHLTSNNVLLRAKIYGVGLLIILLMWGNILYLNFFKVTFS